MGVLSVCGLWCDTRQHSSSVAAAVLAGQPTTKTKTCPWKQIRSAAAQQQLFMAAHMQQCSTQSASRGELTPRQKQGHPQTQHAAVWG